MSPAKTWDSVLGSVSDLGLGLYEKRRGGWFRRTLKTATFVAGMAAEQTNRGREEMPNPSSSSSSASTPPSPSTTAKQRSPGLTHLRIQSQRPAPPPPAPPLLSPLHTSFSQNMHSNSHGHRHARTRSVSTPYSRTPLSPSPLSSSFGFGPDAEPPKNDPAVPIQLQPSKSVPEAFSSQLNGTSVNGNGKKWVKYTIPSVLTLILPGAPLVSHSHPLTQANHLSLGAPPPRRPVPPQLHAHGHARIHSRNLSVFFPRPGATTTTIAEDGAQEISVLPFDHGGYNSSDYDDHAHRQGHDRAKQSDENSNGNDNGPSRTRHRPKQPLTPLGQGFTFGLKPPPAQPGAESTSSSHSSPGVGSNLSPPLPQNEQRMRTLSSSSLSVGGSRTRRGHHHKHSLSHNFFSFLEPGTTGLPHGARETGKSEKETELHTQPAPVPVSQWSAFSHGHSHSHSLANGHLDTHSHASHSRSHTHSDYHYHPTQRTSTIRQTASLIQLALGATLWVRSQQVGSIACTGIGYWVVFDAIGVFLGGYGEGRRGRKRTLDVGKIDQEKELEMIRQPYGYVPLLPLPSQCNPIKPMQPRTPLDRPNLCPSRLSHVFSSIRVQGDGRAFAFECWWPE